MGDGAGPLATADGKAGGVRTYRAHYADCVSLCDGGAGNYLALVAAVLAQARIDAAHDPRALAWLRTSGVWWAAELGVEHPECIAEGIR